MSVVTWFEIPVSQLERAKAFYEHLLSVQLTHVEMGPQRMEMFPADPSAQGAPGALVQAEDYVPSQHGSMVYLFVADIGAALTRASERGGSTIVPKMGIGDGGHVAMMLDCEGNRVGLHALS